MNANDGHTLWKAADAKPTHGTPVLAQIGGDEVVITPAGDIVRLGNGEVLCTKLFESTYATPLVVGNVLYVIDATAMALELPPKAAKGMKLKELWQTGLRGTFMASPAYRDGLIYTVENQKSRLYILDAKTGEVLTVTRVVDEATKAETIEPGVKLEGLARAKFVYASPVVAQRHVYFFDDAGNTAVIELGRKYRLVRVNKLDDGFVGTPFYIQNKIIFRGSQTVYCIGAKP